jgi:ribonuclease HI/exonuclease III
MMDKLKTLTHTVTLIIFLFSVMTQYTQDNNCLNILQWNARSINTTGDFLQHYLSGKEYDILMLQSLNCRRNKLPQIQGFCHPPYCKAIGDKVAVATYVRTSLFAVNKPFPEYPQSAHLCTEIQLKTGPLRVLNCYHPKGDREGAWVDSINTTEAEYIIGGDFNSRSALWEEDSPVEHAGLRDKIIDSELVIMNDGRTTRIPDRPEQAATTLDLTFATPGTASNVEWDVEDNLLSSDHLPIVIKVDAEAIREEQQQDGKFCYERADWEAFRAFLNQTPVLPEGITPDDINNIIVEELLSAADKSIPKSKAKRGKRLNAWWNKQCETAVKQKNKQFKIYRKHPTKDNHQILQQLKAQCNRVIAEAKIKQWEEVMESDNGPDLTYLYKKIKEIKGNYNSPNAPLIVNGTKVYTNEEKANIMVDTFATASRIEGLSAEMREHRERIEKDLIEDPKEDNSVDYNKMISLAELERTLQLITKVKVASGPDKVSYQMIKNAPTKYKTKILRLFNTCWEEGSVPPQWKEAIVAPIPKAGKPRNNPSSYRPIALTSHLGKVFERIAQNRLNYHCEQHNVIPLCQAGFRKGRGVSDHLAKIASHVRKAMSRRKVLFTCFFDVRRAYDSVWHHKLLLRIKEINVQGRMYNFIKSFLTNRNIRVRWRGALSERRVLHMGVPQGSVIAPLLFSIMTSKINESRVDGCDILVYADDVAITHQSTARRLTNLDSNNRHFKQSKTIFQKQVDNISTFMFENGFMLAPNKTQYLLITECIFRCDHPALALRVDNVLVPPIKEATYLGVVFCTRGTWTKHVNNRITAAAKALNIIKLLAGMPWAAQDKLLVNVTQSLVRSRLLYGVEATYSMSDAQCEKLTKVEVKALKLALGLPTSTPTYEVYREAGLLPLEEEITRRCANYVVRNQAGPNSTTLDELKEPTLSKFHISKQKACSMIDKIKILTGDTPIQVTRRPPLPEPPWDAAPLPIKPDLENISKKDNPNTAGAKANSYIDEHLTDTLKIYTDGSKGPKGTGAAFWAEQFQHERKFYLGNTSVFTAELVAILMALNFIQTKGNVGKWVILTDSKSVADALLHKGGEAREQLIRSAVTLIQRLKQNGIELEIQWVPAHVGIPGNNKADKLARQAAQNQGAIHITIPSDSNDYINNFRKKAWDKWKDRFALVAKKRKPVDDRPPTKGLINLGTHPVGIRKTMRKMRCGVWKTKYLDLNCTCGKKMSLQHAVAECPHTPLKGTRPKTIGEVAREHPDRGWEWLREVAEALRASPMGPYL